MSLNNTPSAERVHIGFFGKRNAGKSSLVNAVTGQELAVVSEKRGTTTDPVQKAMELLPIGPVVIIDTPGFDDEGNLGEKRVKKTRQVLGKTDVAVLVAEAGMPLSKSDEELIGLFDEKKIPYIIAWNKCDIAGEENVCPGGKKGEGKDETFGKAAGEIYVSALCGTNIYELKELIGRLGKGVEKKEKLIADLIEPRDRLVLVIPIDSAAPKGRIILPQQQVIRDILDAGAIVVCTRETELTDCLSALKEPPAMVVTDSQAFESVNRDTPKEIPLTSFSILMARYKGYLESAASAVKTVDSLKDGDRVLIAEGCTHHRQCDDIGTVKIPRWLKEYTGKEISIDTCSGIHFPEDLSGYKLVIHCGGCMLNDREIKSRMEHAAQQKVPMTNYGIFIAYVNGILERSLALFPGII